MDAFDQRLHEALSYDPETGQMLWLGGNYRGHVAGHVGSSGVRRIVFEGTRYDAADLAYRYMTGRWPTEIMWFKNGNPRDERWCNVTHETTRRTRPVTLERLMKSLFSAAVALLTAIAPAHAVLQIASDINGIQFFCADQQACDGNATPGVLQIGSQNFGGVSLFGSLQSQQIGPANFLNTSSLQLTNTGASDATITVAVGGTDFLGPVASFSASGAATFQNADGSTVQLQFYGDPANAQGADDANDTPGTLLADSGVFIAAGAADAMDFSEADAFVDADLHSMTLWTTGTLEAGGTVVNRGQTLVTTAVPEPGSLALLGGALVGLGLIARRRRGVPA